MNTIVATVPEGGEIRVGALPVDATYRVAAWIQDADGAVQALVEVPTFTFPVAGTAAPERQFFALGVAADLVEGLRVEDGDPAVLVPELDVDEVTVAVARTAGADQQPEVVLELLGRDAEVGRGLVDGDVAVGREPRDEGEQAREPAGRGVLAALGGGHATSPAAARSRRTTASRRACGSRTTTSEPMPTSWAARPSSSE